MADITAQMVKALRDMTGVGMMECKKALAETGGDMKEAEDLLRIKGGARANKAAARIAADGMVAAYIAPDGTSGALVEVNCETDFVAKNQDFIHFARRLAELISVADIADTQALAAATFPDGEIVDELRKALVMKLGENISVRRFARHAAKGRLASYLHGAKIGVMVDYSGGDDALGKDLAMHIAASKPVCVAREQVSPELLARERLIYTAQATESNKPPDIVAKMVDGRMAKYLAEITLLGQPFVKDPEQIVEKLLAAKTAMVHAFTLFVVGEGIDKASGDFAADVMAQVRQGKEKKISQPD
jgi:elongation factor Ts